jgi:hypothetical protein
MRSRVADPSGPRCPVPGEERRSRPLRPSVLSWRFVYVLAVTRLDDSGVGSSSNGEFVRERDGLAVDAEMRGGAQEAIGLDTCQLRALDQAVE